MRILAIQESNITGHVTQMPVTRRNEEFLRRLCPTMQLEIVADECTTYIASLQDALWEIKYNCRKHFKIFRSKSMESKIIHYAEVLEDLAIATAKDKIVVCISTNSENVAHTDHLYTGKLQNLDLDLYPTRADTLIIMFDGTRIPNFVLDLTDPSTKASTASEIFALVESHAVEYLKNVHRKTHKNVNSECAE